MNCNDDDLCLKSISFNFQTNEMSIEIENPGKKYKFLTAESQVLLPSDVSVGDDGSSWWVEESSHLFIAEFENTESTNNPDVIEILNTSFYNVGNNLKSLDIVLVEKKGDGTKKTKKVRREVVVVSTGGG